MGMEIEDTIIRRLPKGTRRADEGRIILEFGPLDNKETEFRAHQDAHINVYPNFAPSVGQNDVWCV